MVGASYHYEVTNDPIQCKEADFVWPPFCNMKDLKIQKLNYEYKWLNILLDARFMGGVLFHCYELKAAILLRLSYKY